MSTVFFRCLFFFSLVCWLFSCQEERVLPKHDPTEQARTDEALILEFIAKDTTINAPVRTPNGVYYVKRKPGTGPQVQKGNNVKVHYIGRYLNETSFESSYTTNSPISFKVGAGRVIKGWDEGLPYFENGETARLYIPSALAYGPNGNGRIPGNAVLIFDIQVLEVNP